MPPTLSPRSAATRSATPTAEMRRGCVHTIEHGVLARAASSSTYCGTCVVLPHPVSPSTTTTCWLPMARSSSARCEKAGSASRCALSGAPAGGAGTAAARGAACLLLLPLLFAPAAAAASSPAEYVRTYS